MLPEQDATSVAMQYVFKGGEVLLKISGAAAKNLALLLFAFLQQKNRTSGRVRIKTMAQKGEPLMTFPIPVDKLNEFKKLATDRGVIFAKIPSRKNKNATHFDLIARQIDVVLIKDIFGKLGFGELPVSGKIESTPITKEMRMKNELDGVTTAYDHEVIETAERPTISGRRGGPSAQRSGNLLDTEKRPSVRDTIKLFNTKQAPIVKYPTKVKKPPVPTK
jgi:hypothetical protein